MNFILQTVLSRKYKFNAVGDVFRGMQELKANEGVELIVVDADYNPEESWEFIRHIKSSWIYSRPVIMLTSDKTLLGSEKAAQSGVDFFFQKPFSPIDLIKTIDTLLHTSSAFNV